MLFSSYGAHSPNQNNHQSTYTPKYVNTQKRKMNSNKYSISMQLYRGREVRGVLDVYTWNILLNKNQLLLSFICFMQCDNVWMPTAIELHQNFKSIIGSDMDKEGIYVPQPSPSHHKNDSYYSTNLSLRIMSTSRCTRSMLNLARNLKTKEETHIIRAQRTSSWYESYTYQATNQVIIE